jgi:hypothetical protein
VITERIWNHPPVTARTSISLWSAAGLAVTAVALAGCGSSSTTDRPAAAVSSATASPLARASTQSQCGTAIDAVIATASASAGNCTQVAYSASNPGYKLTVSPAPALKKVLASKGPAC